MSDQINCPMCSAVLGNGAETVSGKIKCPNCGESVSPGANPAQTGGADASPPKTSFSGRMRRASFSAAAGSSDTKVKKAVEKQQQVEKQVAEAASADPYIGRILGEYCIQKKLSAGDRTIVYLGYHQDSNSPAAVKILNRECVQVISRQEETFFNLMRERQKIKHPNLIGILDVGKCDDCYFLITEYVEGERLEKRLQKQGKFPLFDAVNNINQLCRALQILHKNGLTCCGLRPHNVIVDQTGVLKAALFGLNSLDDCFALPGGSESSVLAAHYLAPEQADKHIGGGQAVDIYALGCIFYHLLAGKPLYNGATVAEVMRQHCSAPLPELATDIPQLSKSGCELILKLLAKNPQERFASAKELQDALQPVLGEAASAESSATSTAVVGNNSDMETIFGRMQEYGASDLHIKIGSPPTYRIRGEIYPVNTPPLQEEEVEKLIKSILTEEQIGKLKENQSHDISLNLEDKGRYRVHVFYQRNSLSLCARSVLQHIPTIDELFLPEGVKQIADYKDGLVLVSGATGSGKSTTLATIIGLINSKKRGHIVTIEDPIEYLHQDNLSYISQREIGIDVQNFYNGLKDALRQAPDVILIGEMRDADTVETALSASETGHLVMSTMHAKDATEAIKRLLVFFPPERHDGIRELLGGVLRAIICQRMIHGKQEAHPRVVAMELMFVNDVIRQCIVDNEYARIPRQLQNFSHEGMLDFNASLVQLVRRELVHPRIALRESPRPKDIEALFASLL